MVEGSPNAPQVHFGREIHFLASVDKRFFVHVWVLWEGRGEITVLVALVRSGLRIKECIIKQKYSFYTCMCVCIGNTSAFVRLQLVVGSVRIVASNCAIHGHNFSAVIHD